MNKIINFPPLNLPLKGNTLFYSPFGEDVGKENVSVEINVKKNRNSVLIKKLGASQIVAIGVSTLYLFIILFYIVLQTGSELRS